MRRHTLRGFTLIELMVTVAIVAILAAIAYPSYQETILKGRRAEARTALADLLQQQERYLTQRGQYLPFTAATPVATAPFKRYSGDSDTGSAYDLSAELCDAPNNQAQICVRVVAVPRLADLAGGTLKFESTGVKSCTGIKPEVCWK